ncbi:hypothetical protein Q7P36_007498 [Cladosporium allicinum]
MSSHQSSTSEKKPSVDTASVLSSSTTSSMSTLLKKFTPKSKSSSKSDDELSPGEKQAKRQAARTSPQTLATWASLREKAARIIDRPGEDDVLDPYAARRGTMFLRAGSL